MNDFKIVLSGTFHEPKADLKDKLAQAGYKWADMLNKRAILVCGYDAKERQFANAQLLGVPIVTESYLNDALALGKLPNPADEKYTFIEMSDGRNKKRKAAELVHSDKPWLAKRRKPVEHMEAGHTRAPVTAGPKGQVIALEGLIGIGKSTLCNKLVEQYPEDCDVYREQTNEQFLQLFYSDPKKYGFALQWGMLKSRIYQLRLAQHDTKYGRNPPCQYYYWDRSMIGDYVFALWNHLTGGISQAEMNVYESEFGGSVRQIEKIPFLKDINMFVFMDDEPSRCKERVEVLRKNASEQGIPLPYYEGLDDMHFHICLSMLMKGVSRVLVVTWGQYNDPKAVQSQFAEALAGKSEAATVEVINLDDVPPRPGNDKVIYRNARDVKACYKLLRSRNGDEEAQSANERELTARANAATVYIPQNIMTVDPKDKGVQPNDFNITFYQNEYKRVVMWHLSHGQHIAFYRV